MAPSVELQEWFQLAEGADMQDKTIVIVLPDSGERYLSSALFEGVSSEQELTA